MFADLAVLAFFNVCYFDGGKTLRLATMDLCIKELYLSSDSNPNEGAINPKNENTDVIVLVETCDANHQKSTAKYVASFFSYDNINALKSQHAKTGDYLNGKYFFSKNMLLIDDCSMENVRAVVEHLIDEGEFGEVFRRI